MSHLLTLDDFAPYAGSLFPVALDDGGMYPLTLVAARRIETIEFPARVREPFELRFAGPGPAHLPQATVPIEHPALGRIDVFIVPIEYGEAGVRYQAIFT